MKKVLVIRFSALGDVAMLAPVVRDFAMENADVEYTVLSKPFCRPLFEGLADNVRFLGIDPKKDYHGIMGLYRLFRTLHACHYDQIIDAHDVLRTKVLRLFFRLAGYPVSVIDKHRKLRKLITAPPPKKVLRQLPTSFENYREAMGTPPNLPQGEEMVITTSETEENNSQNNSKFSPLGGVRGGLSLGIAPFAAHGGKIYPLDKMEKVIALLLERNAQVTIYLFGGGGKERQQMQQWAQKYPRVQLAADTCKGLADELRLMATLDVMISMDSANMHLASLVGTRVVSIWGATHPYAGFLGWKQSSTDCIQHDDLPCRPCSIYGNKPCTNAHHMACMDIKPEEIVNHIL